MVHTSGPVTPRRRLAAALRRLREEADLRLEQVADQLLISRSKLSRLENAQGRPHPRDVHDLIQFYGLSGTPRADQMVEWLDAARTPPWWDKYRRLPGFDTHVAYESEASRARIYAVPLLPVLLQTPDYVRAYCRGLGYGCSDDQIEEQVALRHRRQMVLTDRKPRPLELSLVVYEACLRQVVGSPAVMRKQLDAVVEWSTLPNVELRVLPFTAALVPGAGCGFTHFTFAEADESIVSIDCHTGHREIAHPRQLATFDTHYRELQDRSLAPAASRDLVLTVASSYG
jgi:transcriptional regulator with XRE-family HTH domain